VYLNKLGIALHQQAALGAALKYYERASKVDPSYADAQNNIGTIWYQRKKFGRASRRTKAINIRSDMAVLPQQPCLRLLWREEISGRPSLSSSGRRWRWNPQLFEHNSSRSGSILQDRSGGATADDSISSWQSPYAEAGQPGTRIADLSAEGQGRRLQGAFGREIRSFLCGGLEGSRGARGSCSEASRRHATLSGADRRFFKLCLALSGATRALVSVTMQQTWRALSAARVIWFLLSAVLVPEPLRLPRNNTSSPPRGAAAATYQQGIYPRFSV